MKVKVIATMVLLLSLSFNAMGQEGKKSLGSGYRGFVEVDIPGISTTHGYQFNPNIFAGAGDSFEEEKEETIISHPAKNNKVENEVEAVEDFFE